jgi:hypothetical protein
VISPSWQPDLELHQSLLNSVQVVSSKGPGMGKTHIIYDKLGIESMSKTGSYRSKPVEISINGKIDLAKILESEEKIQSVLNNNGDIYIQLSVNTNDEKVLEEIDNFIFMICILRVCPYKDSFIILDQKETRESYIHKGAYMNRSVRTIRQNRIIYIEVGNDFQEAIKERITSLLLFEHNRIHIAEFDLGTFDMGDCGASAIQMY